MAGEHQRIRSNEGALPALGQGFWNTRDFDHSCLPTYIWWTYPSAHGTAGESAMGCTPGPVLRKELASRSDSIPPFCFLNPRSSPPLLQLDVITFRIPASASVRNTDVKRHPGMFLESTCVPEARGEASPGNTVTTTSCLLTGMCKR
ncbi:hypothetical protein LEMLEM_LOCUS15133 [Lemmus lemmus]